MNYFLSELKRPPYICSLWLCYNPEHYVGGSCMISLELLKWASVAEQQFGALTLVLAKRRNSSRSRITGCPAESFRPRQSIHGRAAHNAPARKWCHLFNEQSPRCLRQRCNGELLLALKTECRDRKAYRSRNPARADVFEFIERLHNLKRRHSMIGCLTPVEIERKPKLLQQPSGIPTARHSLQHYC